MSDDQRCLLVTGGAGFIGSAFVRHVLAERPSWRVVTLDALTYAGRRENLAGLDDGGRHTFVHADVRDPAAVASALAPCDTVVHLAAESHVDRSIDDAAPFLETNVLGTQVLLDACRAHAESGARFRGFVHVSTDEVYGQLPLDRPDLKFDEDSPLRPRSPYAASKAASDLLALAAHHTFGLPVAVTRCSNNYGPRQFPEKVIPLFVTNLVDGRPVPLYGDGRNVRDWLHVTDHCRALLAVVEGGRPGAVYNVGGDNERSNLELTRTILELTGHDESMIERVADRQGHDLRYAIDASRIERELGWRPVHADWRRTLAETIDWYRANEAWWHPLKARLAVPA